MPSALRDELSRRAMTDMLRPARATEVARLNTLIAASARALSQGYYTPAQTEQLIRRVFGVDTQLITDQTYFVIERDAHLVACGGWSARRTLFGGDQAKSDQDPRLDPATEAARIRAFFVHPEAARQGLGRRVLSQCEACASAAGFRQAELMATLPGEPFYRAAGYEALEFVSHRLPDGEAIPFVRMGRTLRSVVSRSLACWTFLCLPGAAALAGQASSPERFAAPERNELTLTAEPLAAGAQYLRSAGRGWLFGGAITAGPSYPVFLRRGDFGRLREWSTAYPLIGYRFSPAVEAVISPIGAALAVGDDFGSVYPSAQTGVTWLRGALRVGTLARVVRLAGPNGSGIYRVLWIPVRVGYAMRW